MHIYMSLSSVDATRMRVGADEKIWNVPAECSANESEKEKNDARVCVSLCVSMCV